MLRTINLLFVAVILVTAATGPAIAATEGSPEISVHLPDNRVAAGDEAVLNLFLLNGGNITSGGPQFDEARVTTARNVTVEMTAGDAPIDIETATQPVGSVPEGRLGPVQFTVTVAENADPGRYEVPVEVSYNYTSRIESNDPDRDHDTVSRTIERTVTLVVEERARFAVVTTATDAFSGETGDLTLTIENVGTEIATDARISLQSSDPALTFGGTASADVFVGDWAPGQRRTVTVSSRFAAGTSRSHPVSATVTFEDGDGETRSSDRLQFGITPVQGTSRFPVVNASADLAVGERGTIEIRVRNDGDSAVRAARVTVESPDSALSFSGTPTTTSFAGTWQPGEIRTFDVSATVDSGADVHSYPLSVTVAYQTANGESRQSSSATTGIVPRPEQSFSLHNVSSTLAVGDEGTVRGMVKNTGETAIRNAVVILSADNANLVPIETEFAIGDLQPGGSATFAFNAEITHAADAGPRQLSMTVRYRDADDDVRRSDPLDAQVDVGPRQDRFGVEPVGASFEPGTSGLLELRVTNNGAEVVSDVSAKLFTDEPLSSSDDEAFISSLDTGESTVIRFALSIASGAVERKVYPVSLDFQYEDADGDTRLSDSYDVAIQVTSPEGQGGPPLVIIGVAAVGLLALLGALWYHRHR